ncbi:hypothetical protein PoB_000027300 [Plakobranchus ocellatus]|uniref:Uncharacterized protein n=1 Tax=Plakobranchus ocellatus TaxID=259542 RepID=A0AAV3XTQ2_9GAST|nr:hypothetical protein PoB_000027300 [Plakobranchus ocellatus]
MLDLKPLQRRVQIRCTPRIRGNNNKRLKVEKGVAEELKNSKETMEACLIKHSYTAIKLRHFHLKSTKALDVCPSCCPANIKATIKLRLDFLQHIWCNRVYSFSDTFLQFIRGLRQGRNVNFIFHVSLSKKPQTIRSGDLGGHLQNTWSFCPSWPNHRLGGFVLRNVRTLRDQCGGASSCCKCSHYLQQLVLAATSSVTSPGRFGQ